MGKGVLLSLIIATVLVIFLGNLHWQKQSNQYQTTISATEEEKSLGDENELINLPKVIYNTVDMKTNIFHQNLVQEKINGTDDYLKIRENNSDWTRSDYSKVNHPKPGTTNLAVELYKSKNLIAVDQTKIITSQMRTTPIKGLVMGDSTIITDGFGFVTKRIEDNLESNIELVGTMGDGRNRFEGRGGWAAAKYRTNEIYMKKGNPFYNQQKKDFDFEYYMKDQSYTDLDFVIINLGINDVLSYRSTADLMNDFDEILADFDHIINSIKAYDNEIKIGINLTIPPSNSQDLFIKEHGKNLNQAQVKANNFLWVQKLIDYYGDSDKVDVVPIYLVVDTKNNFASSVHPNEDGYNQIGDQITSYLNSLN